MLLQLAEPGQKLSSLDKSPLYSIGIDLGTTHSVVGIYIDDHVQILPIEGSTLIPSAVAYEQEQVIVGKKAFEHEESLTSFKRIMKDPSLLCKGKSPVELSAEILKFIRQEVEKLIGHPILNAVITVPAYFDDTARQATKDAAKLAGLDVLRLINEPTSAALAYGLDNELEGIYAIYDLGGGTFDISILKLEKGIFKVLSTAGDLELGGDDIDAAIAHYWQSKNSCLPFMIKKAREAKEYLTKNLAWNDNDLSLSRDELSKLITPFVEKTFSICERALLDANLKKQDLKGVVLVGGSTKNPHIQEAVEAYFHKKPLMSLDPDHVVAYGAAIQAQALTKGAKTLLVDVAPLSLGLETMGGVVEKIISRNTPIPTEISQEFTTFEHNQSAMRIHVVQGERELAKDCRSLAEFTLNGIPPMVAGSARVQVAFKLDADGLLSVRAKELKTGVEQHVMVKPSYGLTSDQLEKMIKEGFALSKEDMAQRLLVEARVEAQRIINHCELALKEDANLLEENEYVAFVQALDTVKSLLTSSNRDELLNALNELKHLSAPFAQKRMNHAIQRRLVGYNV